MLTTIMSIFLLVEVDLKLVLLDLEKLKEQQDLFPQNFMEEIVCWSRKCSQK